MKIILLYVYLIDTLIDNEVGVNKLNIIKMMLTSHSLVPVEPVAQIKLYPSIIHMSSAFAIMQLSKLMVC